MTNTPIDQIDFAAIREANTTPTTASPPRPENYAPEHTMFPGLKDALWKSAHAVAAWGRFV